MPEEILRYAFEFTGRVQGVGFRYTAQILAHNHNLSGWVRNNTNGTVSMEVQGTAENINSLLSALMNDRFIRIEDYSCKKLPPDPDEHFFRTSR